MVSLTPPERSKPHTRRDVTINLRAPARLRDLIDRAASAVGTSRSEFMLDSARSRAENVLLDQTRFALDERRLAEFERLLERPVAPNAALRRLLARKAPWER